MFRVTETLCPLLKEKGKEWGCPRVVHSADERSVEGDSSDRARGMG